MRRLVLLVAAIVLVDTMFFAAITPLLPYYSARFDLSKSAAGILSATYAVGALAGSIPAGWFAARAGVRPAVLLGLALMALSSVAFAFGSSVAVLDAARLVQGFGGAASWAGGLAWLVGAAPRERRGELLGTALGAAIGGALFGPVLGAAGRAVGPEPVFSGVAVVGIALAAWALRTPAAPPGRAHGLRLLGSSLREPRVAAGMWLVLLPSLLFGVLAVLSPLRLDHLGASGAVIGGVFLVSAGLETVASPWFGRLADRRGPLVPVRIGLAGSALFALVLPWPAQVGLLAVLVVLAGAVFGTLWVPAVALLSDGAEAAGLDQGFAFALFNLAWAAGQIGGAAGGAGLAQATVDAVPYLLLAAACALTLAGSARLTARHAGV